MLESHFYNIDKVISEIIVGSKKTVDIATAWFTHKGLMQTILSHASLSPVKFRVIINDDARNKDFYLDYLRLVNAGVEVMIYKGDSKWNLMHNKFAVFDSEIVITGSYNWTKSAESNIENIVVSKDNAEFASNYSEEYERIFKLSKKINFKESNKIDELRLGSLTEEQIWVFLRAFHVHKYNPSAHRVWRAMKGTKSKSIKQNTSAMPFYNTIDNYTSAFTVLDDLRQFFSKYSKEIAIEFQYEERGWNKIDFPGDKIYSLFEKDAIVKIDLMNINKERWGQKWSNAELTLLASYILKTNDPCILSRLLNRSETSVILKAKRILHDNGKLYEDWLILQNNYT